MRIVKDLGKIHECPNCGSPDHLRETENQFGHPYVICINCYEELYEEEDFCYNVGKTPDDIDDSLMEIEYEVGNLPHYATTKDELIQLERIRDIFNELISVIRRMK